MTALLRPDEPEPVSVDRAATRSVFFVTCDHAGNRIPAALGDLGLDAIERARHIAWDIGAAGVAQALAERLEASLVMQNYSRLVIDANRPLASPQSIPVRSEATDIPGNMGLDESERQARRTVIFAPYHDRIAALLDARAAAHQPTLYISVHSFTPVYLGQSRPQHVGVLYGRDRRAADMVLRALRTDESLCVGDNQPYKLDDGDYGVPRHAEDRGLPYVLFEVRQDLIAHRAAQRNWALRLAALLEDVAAALFAPGA